MDWATIRPAILSLVQSLSDVAASNVTWGDQPRPVLDPGAGTASPNPGDRAQIFLSTKNVQAQGQDSRSTVFQGFTSSVVASVFQALPIAQQVANTPLWFTEAAPAPFALNTQYFVVGLSGATFSLAATPSGSAITPMLSSSTGAILSWMPVGAEMQDTYSGIRLFVLELRAESFEQQDGFTAYQYLEEIRQRLYRQTSVAALLAANITWYDANDQTQDLEVAENDRATSVAVLRLHMRAAVSEVDSNSYGYITSATTAGP